MKKICLVLSLTLLLTVGVLAEDFRNINWGMSVGEVKGIEETVALDESESGLLYNATIDNKNFKLVYHFKENKLYKATYVYSENVLNNVQYYLDYKIFQDMLTEKYGEPTYKKEMWLRDLYKGDIQYYGTAVRLGHVVFQTDWENESTQIQMNLIGTKSGIMFPIQYTSKEYAYLEEEEEEESKQKDQNQL